MGKLQDLMNDGIEGSRIGATMTSNQEDGTVCFADGVLQFSPAKALVTSSVPFHLSNSPQLLFECFFSNFVRADPPIDPTPGQLGNFPPTQRFDASRGRKLSLSLSTSLGGLSLHVKLLGGNAVTFRVDEHGDLYIGSGPSLLNGSPAAYILALTVPPAV
jgi:hypothetical protein